MKKAKTKILVLMILLVSCQGSTFDFKEDIIKDSQDTLLLQEQDKLLEQAYIPFLKAKDNQHQTLLEFTLSPYWILQFYDDINLDRLLSKAEYDQAIAKMLPLDSTKEISVVEYLIDPTNQINESLTLNFEMAAVDQYSGFLTLPPLPDNYYENWNEKFPNDLKVISSPILNQDKTQGLIFEYRDNGDRACGNGKHWLIIFEQNEEGKWRVKEEILLL